MINSETTFLQAASLAHEQATATRLAGTLTKDAAAKAELFRASRAMEHLGEIIRLQASIHAAGQVTRDTKPAGPTWWVKFRDWLGH